MPVILTSPKAIEYGDSSVHLALAEIAKSHDVIVVSNKPEPSWFRDKFSHSPVRFRRWPRRQRGDCIAKAAELTNQAAHEIIVLAATDADIAMAKNGRAVLIAGQWSKEEKVRNLGISVASISELDTVVNLMNDWTHTWWYRGDGNAYSVRALSDLSTLGSSVSAAQSEFGQRFRGVVKRGGPNLLALLGLTSRSLLAEGLARDLAWCVYPASNSSNSDSEVLSDFCHRLRTTVSRVKHAARGVPLLIRHKPSTKRSSSSSANRQDPGEQLQTLHVNPKYRGKLSGRTVIVLDDCMTYGVSFAVAAALLRRAGAKRVLGVALGKFGCCTRRYEIALSTNPFAPIGPSGYKASDVGAFSETTSDGAQSKLLELLK